MGQRDRVACWSAVEQLLHDIPRPPTHPVRIPYRGKSGRYLERGEGRFSSSSAGGRAEPRPPLLFSRVFIAVDRLLIH